MTIMMIQQYRNVVRVKVLNTYTAFLFVPQSNVCLLEVMVRGSDTQLQFV